jgi:hypothetical protein
MPECIRTVRQEKIGKDVTLAIPLVFVSGLYFITPSSNVYGVCVLTS